MLIALSGVSGVGKSYFTEIITKELNIKKLTTIRTREKRDQEEGMFVTNSELDDLIKDGKIAFDFQIFGSRYGYLKEEIESNDIYLFELHYETLNAFKKLSDNLISIYILPDHINKAIEMLKKRNMSVNKEKERINDIIEQYDEMNDKAYSLFDYVIVNDYTKATERKIIDLVKTIIKDKNG